MLQTSNNLIAAAGAATSAGVAVATKSSEIEGLLGLPWPVIGLAAGLAGVVAIVAAANRSMTNEANSLSGVRWAVMEFFVGVIAGTAVWSLTEFFNPDPKIQLAATIFAGWHARNALDKYLPEFWQRMTGGEPSNRVKPRPLSARDWSRGHDGRGGDE